MKIKLSKKQWEVIGKKTGWLNMASVWGHIGEDFNHEMEMEVLKNRNLNVDQLVSLLNFKFDKLLKIKNINEQELREFVVDILEIHKSIGDW
jgi:hypothetical protein